MWMRSFLEPSAGIGGFLKVFMELLNEGGMFAFVTSRDITDTPGNKFVREDLVNHADLMTALRLPNNIFMETEGIQVGSYLLVFQKHTRKTTPSHREQLFMQVAKKTERRYCYRIFQQTVCTVRKSLPNNYSLLFFTIR